MLTMYVKYQPPDKWNSVHGYGRQKNVKKLCSKKKTSLVWNVYISGNILQYLKPYCVRSDHWPMDIWLYRLELVGSSPDTTYLSPPSLSDVSLSERYDACNKPQMFIERVISSTGSSCIYILDWLSVFCLFLVHLVHYICIDLNAKLC